jgi:hypothetical protein
MADGDMIGTTALHSYLVSIVPQSHRSGFCCLVALSTGRFSGMSNSLRATYNGPPEPSFLNAPW